MGGEGGGREGIKRLEMAHISVCPYFSVWLRSLVSLVIRVRSRVLPQSSEVLFLFKDYSIYVKVHQIISLLLSSSGNEKLRFQRLIQPAWVNVKRNIFMCENDF